MQMEKDKHYLSSFLSKGNCLYSLSYGKYTKALASRVHTGSLRGPHGVSSVWQKVATKSSGYSHGRRERIIKFNGRRKKEDDSGL
jgi:hypothetical protein